MLSFPAFPDRCDPQAWTHFDCPILYHGTTLSGIPLGDSSVRLFGPLG